MAEIDRLIHASSFHEPKAKQIHAIARRAEEEFGGVLPTKYWIEINRLLVPFGKHVCTGVRPKCSACRVLEYCRKVGVTEHRQASTATTSSAWTCGRP